jgi:hypothetical protein
MATSRVLGFLLTAMCAAPLPLLIAACGESGTSPTAPNPTSQPAATVVPTPTITNVRITGRSALTAIGEKTQLSALASYSDGSTKDVSGEAAWTSDQPAIFTVSAGEVTALGFGIGGIVARVGTRQGYLQVAATPAGTVLFWGRVREPGLSGMAGVRVLEMNSGRSQITGAGGNFQFPGLGSARFRFEREGYEPVEMPAAGGVTTPAGTTSFTDAALQRLVRITAGDSLNEDLAPHDLSYSVGGETCYPCKLIRVMVPTSGTLRLNATWTGTSAGMSLWVNGVRFRSDASVVVAEAPVNAGEVLVHAGAHASAYVKFALTTSSAP